MALVQNEIGGRTADFELDGVRYEIGAGVFHGVNRYVADAVREVGLATVDAPEGTLGVWDGSGWRFRESVYSVVTAVRALYAWGLSPMNLRGETAEVVAAFLDVYDLQDAGQGYESVPELLEAIGLLRLTQRTLREYLTQGRRKLTAAFVDDLVAAVTRVQYGQSPEINALAGMVALVGVEPDLHAVATGNAALPKALLNKVQGLELRLQTAVTSIEAVNDDSDAMWGTRYVINGERGTLYDAVFVATPLEFASSLEFTGIPHVDLAVIRPAGSGIPPSWREFQVTHATFVAGKLDARYFGAAEADEEVPSFVGTAEVDSLPFSSVAVKGYSTTYSAPVRKIFSRQAMERSELDKMFQAGYTVLGAYRWRAYPKLRPSPTWARFEIAPRLYYINAFESAVSCMETQAISARNAANLFAAAVARADAAAVPPFADTSMPAQPVGSRNGSDDHDAFFARHDDL
ncbi:uncharacterized protein AMSG_09026 [Thecamonas trahens ATCC 50062]|uniref:Prenylcysteine lyase domain-containing protein n=1 Tax=Thecamonas trahens ATCC 50062 TaxID=461836 RepID=A0A0L0DLE9_THETB|nr:hypothetical protein AMSG_09026 [Thecamonas trahens ATCC 50062]KNC52871.1 hypothetical protein AMSG_09026 [Thecamonas trahens ATCC 50062]|eukprot:XP_013754970.1 hypothetical protein AMSG_09026 [Thecamonas trahens ATCC 50062]